MPSLLGSYQACLQKRPIITKSITCALLFILGDFIAQKVEFGVERKWDRKRSMNFAIVGATYYGPCMHLWYCRLLPKLASRFFANSSKRQRVLGSVGLDQVLFTPLFYCGYYIIDSIVQSRELREGGKTGVRKIKEKLLETLIADLLIWPIATGINLWYVPLMYQVLFANVICLGWDVVLCHITQQ